MDLAYATAPTTAAPAAGVRRRAVEGVAPAWFGAVMGTGIVAVAVKLLPVALPGAREVALAMWALAATLLVGLVVLAVRARAWRGALADPAIAPTLGVPPMAVLTVGAATLLVGRDVVGPDAALAVALAAWVAGTVAGVLTALLVPAAMVLAHRPSLADASGTWLLPSVPPVVSASTGAGLVAHLPAGEARLDLLLILYALLGLGLLATLPAIALLWARLILHGPVAAERAPSLWVVLGPLGQSITAVNLLGAASAHVVAAPTAAALSAFGVAYGIPVAGFAALWLALAAALTRHHAARGGVPFSAAWWSFVFPVGTLVTATSELADRTGSVALRGVAVALLAGLVAAWAITAARTLARAPAARPRRRPA